MKNSRARSWGEGDSDFILKHHCLGCQKHADRQNMLIGTHACTCTHAPTHTHTVRQLKSSGDGRLIVYLRRSIEN